MKALRLQNSPALCATGTTGDADALGEGWPAGLGAASRPAPPACPREDHPPQALLEALAALLHHLGRRVLAGGAVVRDAGIMPTPSRRRAQRLAARSTAQSGKILQRDRLHADWCLDSTTAGPAGMFSAPITR